MVWCLFKVVFLGDASIQDAYSCFSAEKLIVDVRNAQRITAAPIRRHMTDIHI